jgi:phosphate acyltransferase
MIKIAIDAMGGDFGPGPIVQGVVDALNEKSFTPVLVGHVEEIHALLPLHLKDTIEIVSSTDVIDMADSATDALKRKESSIYKAVDLVKSGTCNAVVSAGHSGATMALATLRIGRLKGVQRPPLATFMPTKQAGKRVLVMDVGANVDCDPENLYQFALMGGAYAKMLLKVDSPKVGLLSNGEEDSKGNEVTKAAFKSLKDYKYFAGNAEANAVFSGEFDVVVCDGFIGNILLKTSEGVASMMGSFIKKSAKKSPLSLAGALMMKKVFNSLKKETDYAEYGGAPLIGLKGCAIIGHGKSNAKAIKNAIFQAISYEESGVTEEISKNISLNKN